MYFLSKDNTKIYYSEWNNVENPKGVLHIVHGMAEYIERYDDFAKYLNQNGIIVYGLNARGHGNTGLNQKKLGYFGNDDWNNIMDDIDILMNMEKEKYPNLPFFILGHSMGSFITRNFINKFNPRINGAIIVGTGSCDSTLVYSLTKKIADAKKSEDLALFIHKTVFKDYNNHLENIKTSFDWLCSDPNEVKKYKDDELCGFWMTNGFYSELMSGLIQLSKFEKNISIPNSLPILFLAGKEDPVGKLGKYVRETYDKYVKQDIKDVKIKLYDGMRHEIINEVNKDEVYNDVLNFIKRNI